MKKRSHARHGNHQSAEVVPILWFGPGEATDEIDREISRLTALAVQILGSRDKADRWLRRPRPEFGDVCPLEMMDTPAGARQVERLLAQLAAGG